MEKILLLLCAIFYLSGTSIAQNEGSNDLLLDKGALQAAFNYYDWLKKLNQDSIRYFEGEKCKGEIVDTFKNGKIKFKAVFKDGFPEGLTKEFYENGALKETGSVTNGVRVGKWKVFNENGTLKFIKEFDVSRSSQEIGFNYPFKSISFFENGSVKSYLDHDDKMNLLQSYTMNLKGDTLSSFTLLDPKKKIYLETERFDNGQIRIRGKHKLLSAFRYQKIGLWKTFNEKGEIIQEEEYKD
jgi:antitoxin component YwqK of YwqJK toxin-antitoxin module